MNLSEDYMWCYGYFSINLISSCSLVTMLILNFLYPGELHSVHVQDGLFLYQIHFINLRYYSREISVFTTFLAYLYTEGKEAVFKHLVYTSFGLTLTHWFSPYWNWFCIHFSSFWVQNGNVMLTASRILVSMTNWQNKRFYNGIYQGKTPKFIYSRQIKMSGEIWNFIVKCHTIKFKVYCHGPPRYAFIQLMG
jgi:hypothetical protein